MTSQVIVDVPINALTRNCRSVRGSMNESSVEILKRLFSEIMEWRKQYDPNNDIDFQEKWRVEDEKFLSAMKLESELKEEEPSPSQEKKGKFLMTNNVQIKVSEVTQDAEPEKDDYDPTKDADLNVLYEPKKLNKNAVQFVPASISHEIQTVFEGEELPATTPEPLSPSTQSIASPITLTPSLSPITPTPSTSQSTASPINYTSPSPINYNTTNIINNNYGVPLIPVLPLPLFPLLNVPALNYNYGLNACSVPNMIPSQVTVSANAMFPAASAPNNAFNAEQTASTQHRNSNNMQTKPDRIKPKYKYNRECIEESTYFEPRENNHARGNFYISKEMIARMITECIEPFNAETSDDEGLAFSYFKESVAMQINDKQIRVIRTDEGLIIIINIDLHFIDGQNMYLIAMENDPEFVDKVRWCIKDFLTENAIFDKYKVRRSDLPKSSRNTKEFRDALNTPPVNICVDDIIRNTVFESLPKKKSKRPSKNSSLSRTRINVNDLIYFCRQSLNRDNRMVPVVVIKGKKQWVEWKKFVKVYNNEYIGVSLRYYPSNRKWRIECMDYDHGRMFYQHRLVGHNNYSHRYNWSYPQLSHCITTSLDIKDY